MSEQQVAKSMMKTTIDIINKTNKFLQEILKILQEQSKENAGADSLYKHYQSGKKIKSINLPEEEMESFKNHLIAAGVPYVIFDLKNDNSKSVIFRDIDEPKIRLALKAHYVDQKKVHKLSYSDFMAITPQHNVMSIKNLTETEAYILGEQAKKNDVYYTVVKDKDKYNLLFNKADEPLINKAVINMSWDLTGNLKDYYQAVAEQQVELEKAFKKDYAEEIFYIVDRNNPQNYFRVHEDQVDYIKNNQLINSFNFKDLDRQYKALKTPVMITEKEFLNLDKTLENKIPVVNEEEVIKEERLKDLYNAKISLITNNLDDYIANDPYNNDVSIDEYISNEIVNTETSEREEDVRELKEHIKDTVEYSTQYEYITKTKELDKIISRAEAQAETIETNTMERGYKLNL